MMQPAVDTLAWTLLHFLWQAAALAVCGGLFLKLSGITRPQTRYAALLVIFGGLMLAPVVTLTCLLPTASRSPDFLVATSSQTGAPKTTSSAMSSRKMSAARSSASQPSSLQASSSQTSFTHGLPAQPQSSEQAEQDWDEAWLLAVSWGTWAESLPENELPAAGTVSLAEGAVSVLSRESGWAQLIVTVWLIGVGLSSLRLFAATAWVYRTVRQSQPVPVEMQQMAARLAQRLGLRRVPRIGVSSAVSEPLALQWFRPLVLLPVSWLTDVPPALLEAVLAHELAHIRRHDLWVNLLQRIVETLGFFHPCVWWVSRQIRLERELCCDADAVRATGQPVLYAQALETVARQRWSRGSTAQGVRPALVVGIGGSQMALLHRVRRVLGLESKSVDASWWVLGLAGAGISLGCWFGATLWTSPVQGDESAASPADAVVALNLQDAEKDADRPRPPARDDDRPNPPREERRGEGRPEGREGPPPRRGEADDRGPDRPERGAPPRERRRDGEPRPEDARRQPGERPDGPRPDGERPGPRPMRPGMERPDDRPMGPGGMRGEVRPPHEIAWELADLMRESTERGQPVPRERLALLVKELQMAHPRGPRQMMGHDDPNRGPMPRGPGFGSPDQPRGGAEGAEGGFDNRAPFGNRRENFPRGPAGMEGLALGQREAMMREMGIGPMPEMLRMMRELREEVERLRKEVHEIRSENSRGGPR